MNSPSPDQANGQDEQAIPTVGGEPGEVGEAEEAEEAENPGGCLHDEAEAS